jgi:hypothetical protein
MSARYRLPDRKASASKSAGSEIGDAFQKFMNDDERDMQNRMRVGRGIN